MPGLIGKMKAYVTMSSNITYKDKKSKKVDSNKIPDPNSPDEPDEPGTLILDLPLGNADIECPDNPNSLPHKTFGL